MCLNRFRADVNALADLLSAEPLADELKNFELAIAELRDGRLRAARRLSRENFHDARGHFLADVNLSAQDVADRLHQLRAAYMLRDLAACAGALRPLRI